jgi:hypothetical protein
MGRRKFLKEGLGVTEGVRGEVFRVPMAVEVSLGDSGEIPRGLVEVFSSPRLSSAGVSVLIGMLEESCSPTGLLSPKSSENREIRGELFEGLI